LTFVLFDETIIIPPF